MKTISNVSLILVFLGLIGCGCIDGCYDHDYSDPHPSYSSDDGYGTPAAETDSAYWNDYLRPSANFTGYVVSAFEVTVDGKRYDDMEHFYTEEMRRLPEKVRAAGYGDEYEVELQAQIGISDLWQNMKVFVASSEPTGFQTSTHVRSDGEFSALLPPDALEKDYKIRALKRISIVLDDGNKAERICYNFSAVEHQVKFSQEALPVILNNFVTKITAYECLAEEEPGLSVPGNVAAPDAEAGGIKVGMSVSEVLRVMGTEGYFVASEDKRCWSNQSNKQPRCQYDLDGEEPCQCWVDFDEAGKMTDSFNISSSFVGQG